MVRHPNHYPSNSGMMTTHVEAVEQAAREDEAPTRGENLYIWKQKRPWCKISWIFGSVIIRSEQFISHPGSTYAAAVGTNRGEPKRLIEGLLDLFNRAHAPNEVNADERPTVCRRLEQGSATSVLDRHGPRAFFIAVGGVRVSWTDLTFPLVDAQETQGEVAAILLCVYCVYQRQTVRSIMRRHFLVAWRGTGRRARDAMHQ